MPRYKADWESEYHDPISDAEDAKQKAFDEYLDAQIMAEIEQCRLDEENAERNEVVHHYWQDEMDYDPYDDYNDYNDCY